MINNGLIIQWLRYITANSWYNFPVSFTYFNLALATVVGNNNIAHAVTEYNLQQIKPHAVGSDTKQYTDRLDVLSLGF